MKGCRSCRFWSALEEYLDRIDPNTTDQKVQIGTCQRHAPPPVTLEVGEKSGETKAESFWPRVDSDSWCGDWEPQAF
jgi:hypothetical protein